MLNMRAAFSLVLCAPICVGAQNLVPNGSFEEYTTCPEFFGYAQYATGWVNLHTNSADYFNRCQMNDVVGVPFNTAGYQEPADGDAYMGMATTIPGLDWYREMVGIALTEPLTMGVPVCLSFKMAIGGFGSWDGNSAMYTSKGLGLRFFNAFPSDWQAYLYPNAAALHQEVVPTDTAIWYLIEGEYLPDSNYTHLAVGNFFADSLSSVLPLDTTGFGAWGVSYAFVDQVRVSYDLQYCGSTGENKQGVGEILRAYPNPFTDRFIVAMPAGARGSLQWDLIDAYGREVLGGSHMSGIGRIEVSDAHLTGGNYFLRVYDNTGAYTPVRLVCVSP